MKKLFTVFLCLMLLLGISAAALASGLTITDGSALLEEMEQFPFAAETGELAVNVRADADAKAAKVGRLERGQQLTVDAASVNEKGEVWYAVTLSDGTEGFVRSDLLVKAEEMETMRAAHELPEAQEYIGNKKSKKFHFPTCRTLPKESNRVYFSSREEAVEKGYDPCGNCKP